jgi:outer membrane protein assembly factor BamB
VPSAGKFSPFYTAGPRIIVLGRGELNVVNAEDGKNIWKYRMKSAGMAFQTAAVSGENVYCFGSGGLYCLDLERQKEAWRTVYRGNVTAVAADDRRVCLGTWGRGCRVFDAETGKLLRLLAGSEKAVFPYVNTGRVTCVSLNGTVSAFRDGEKLFARGLGGKVAFIPLVTEEAVIVQTGDGFLRVLSSGDGAPFWETRVGMQTAALSADRERLYIAFTNTIVAGLDLKNGARIWLKKTGGFAPEFMSCAGNRLAVAGGNRFTVYNAATGEAERTHVTAGRIAGVFTGDDQLVVRLENGLLYAFNL